MQTNSAGIGLRLGGTFPNTGAGHNPTAWNIDPGGEIR